MIVSNQLLSEEFMEKRYQVFVSSTYEDLQEERKEVMQALLELDCMPAGMELFPASNDDQWTLIKRVIDDSDYYLLIIGGRYGSINEIGISYTQMEFEYALAINKPIISFLPKDPNLIIAKNSESTEEGKKKLEKFKKLAEKKLVKYWSNPQDLGALVSRSMIKLIKEFPAEGWIKANSIIDEKSTLEIMHLQKEIVELQKKLDEVETKAPKGAEIFAQGNDIVELSCTFGAENYESEYFDCNTDVKFTWNEIFIAVAPNLMCESDESIMRNCLDKLFSSKMSIVAKDKEFNDLTNFENFKICDNDFNLVKIQLRALGLIKAQQSVRKGLLWILTDYGDYMLTQTLAVRKNKGLNKK